MSTDPRRSGTVWSIVLVTGQVHGVDVRRHRRPVPVVYLGVHRVFRLGLVVPGLGIGDHPIHGLADLLRLVAQLGTPLGAQQLVELPRVCSEPEAERPVPEVVQHRAAGTVGALRSVGHGERLDLEPAGGYTAQHHHGDGQRGQQGNPAPWSLVGQHHQRGTCSDQGQPQADHERGGSTQAARWGKQPGPHPTRDGGKQSGGDCDGDQPQPAALHDVANPGPQLGAVPCSAVGNRLGACRRRRRVFALGWGRWLRGGCELRWFFAPVRRDHGPSVTRVDGW